MPTWQDAQRGMRAADGADAAGQSPRGDFSPPSSPVTTLRVFGGGAGAVRVPLQPGRGSGVLRALGSEEIRDVLREQGSVTVTCEFCQRPYSFDSIDIEALFAESAHGARGDPLGRLRIVSPL